MARVISQMAESGRVDLAKLRTIVGRWLRKIRDGQFPGLTWMVGLLDEVVQDAGLRLKLDLMMFRKSLYTLQGVVAEVGGSPSAFDRVLAVRFLQHLVMEWPARWFTMPNSRDFATRLSNYDLTKAILGYPSSVARFWIEQGLDYLDDYRRSEKLTC